MLLVIITICVVVARMPTKIRVSDASSVGSVEGWEVAEILASPYTDDDYI